MEQKRVKKNDVIFTELNIEKNPMFYIIESGEVEIYCESLKNNS